MTEKELSNLSTGDEEVQINRSDEEAETEPSSRSAPKKKAKRPEPTLELPWPAFVKEAPQREIEKRFTKDINRIISKHEAQLPDYCFLAIMDPESNIGTYDLDQIYNALSSYSSL